MAEERLASRYREMPGKWWHVIALLFPMAAILMAILVLFQAPYITAKLPQHGYQWLLVALLLPLVYFWIPIKRGASRKRLPWYDILAFLLSFAIPLYFVANVWPIAREGWGIMAPFEAIVVGTIMLALIIEASRRAVGLTFAIILLIFASYPLYGFIMPGLLASEPISFIRVVSSHVYHGDGIMGVPMAVYGRLFVGYMFFALTLQALGASELFKGVALAVLGRRRGGYAKVAILSSGLFGMVSGSSTANVFFTGSFTIPAMKKEGFPADFAGGVEACASSGGPLMPPVMGSVAFIMAEFLGVSYGSICLAAAVPAFLYFMALFLQIDAYAARLKLTPPPVMEARIPLWRVALDNIHILIGFVVLVYVLFAMHMEIWAPWIAGGLSIAIGMVRQKTRLNLKGFFSLMMNAGRTLAQLIAIFASIGVIISAFVVTGIAYSFPHILVGIAGGNILILLMMGAIASFIMGMGVPVSAVYIFLAITVAPALTQLGLDLYAAHLFVLYTALWSNITPPVAIAAFAAAGLAGADPMKTGLQAMKLGSAKYILPFFFTLSPALILRGPTTEILQVIPTAIIGLIIICGALEGYIWRIGSIGLPMRLLFLVSGFLLALPGTLSDIIGAILAMALLGGYWLLRTITRRISSNTTYIESP